MLGKYNSSRLESNCKYKTNTNTVNNKYKTQTNTKSASAARAVVGKCIRRLDQVRNRPGQANPKKMGSTHGLNTTQTKKGLKIQIQHNTSSGD